MGKPLKARALKGSSLRSSVLARQGVKTNKRVRLGHTGHFGKILEVPIEKKVSKEVAGAERPEKRRKSKFNKFKQGRDQGGQQEEGVDSGGEVDNCRQVLNAAGDGDRNADEGDHDRVERVPGESFCKFMKRLNTETREKLNLQASKAIKMSTRRKEHLTKRKEQKKDKQDEKVIRRMKGSDDDESVGKDRVQHKLKTEELTYVKFGEQAERPPLIKLSTPLKGIKKDVVFDSKGFVHGGVPNIPELSDASRNKREFEMLRKNAISQYRSIIQKKRVEKGLVSIGQI